MRRSLFFEPVAPSRLGAVVARCFAALSRGELNGVPAMGSVRGDNEGRAGRLAQNSHAGSRQALSRQQSQRRQKSASYCCEYSSGVPQEQARCSPLSAAVLSTGCPRKTNDFCIFAPQARPSRHAATNLLPLIHRVN